MRLDTLALAPPAPSYRNHPIATVDGPSLWYPSEPENHFRHEITLNRILRESRSSYGCRAPCDAAHVKINIKLRVSRSGLRARYVLRRGRKISRGRRNSAALRGVEHHALLFQLLQFGTWDKSPNRKSAALCGLRSLGKHRPDRRHERQRQCSNIDAHPAQQPIQCRT